MVSKQELGELNQKIIAWGAERKLLNKELSNRQLIKFFEEAGELAQDFSKSNRAHMIDSIGDVFVTLTIFAEQQGITMNQALEKAYSHIKDRKGKLVNGTFIKNADLNKKEE